LASPCCCSSPRFARRHCESYSARNPVTGIDLLIVAAASTLGYAATRLDRRMHPDHHPDDAG